MRRTLRCLGLALFLMTGVAEARSEKTLAYPRDSAWATAVRFVRVDAKLTVVEKDAEAGYVLFEYTEDKKTFRGSLELIEVVQDDRKAIRFVITIEDRPTWVEIAMLTKLEQKLRAELGSPSPAPTPKPKKPKDDDAPKKDEPKSPPPPKDDGPPISDAP